MYHARSNLIYCWKLDNKHSVVSSELFAIYKALCFIEPNPTNNIIILSDSKTALLLIKNSHPKTYKNIVYYIQLKILQINNSGNIHLHWVKGHHGVAGNDIADKAANMAHNNNRTEAFPLTHSENLSIIKAAAFVQWKQYWEFNVQSTNTGTFLFNLRDGDIQKTKFIFNQLKRRDQVLLTRLRIGHAGVNSYLARFHIIAEQDCSNCGHSIGDFEHYFLYCPTFDEERYQLESSINQLGLDAINLKILFGGTDTPYNTEITKLLMPFIRQTDMHNSL